MNNIKKRSLFLQGLIDGLPICFGYLSVAFAFGISAVGSGLSALEALLISMTNVTSAGQVAGIGIIAAGGSLIEMAVSQIGINLRYALMSVSLSQKLGKSIRLFDRFIIAFVNTDEVFGVASGKSGNVERSYMYGLIIPPYIGWSIGTITGALAGNILPASVTSALGIAVYGMFVAIVMPKAKAEHPVAICALAAIVLSCAFKYLPVLSSVPGGFSVIICAVVASAVFAFVAPIKQNEEDER
ncbi:MAG: AzlC family ABC transporter permease [Clostridia bacterium]|nr:AzlC family ABC transporter permease [Clostridia bacterium]